jgi:aminopeptidase-like protein
MLTQVIDKQSDMEYMLRDMERTLTQLNQTVVGNPTYGQKGLVSEISDIKTYVDKDKMIKNKIIGGLAVVGVVWSVIYHYVVSIFKR